MTLQRSHLHAVGQVSVCMWLWRACRWCSSHAAGIFKCMWGCTQPPCRAHNEERSCPHQCDAGSELYPGPCSSRLWRAGSATGSGSGWETGAEPGWRREAFPLNKWNTRQTEPWFYLCGSCILCCSNNTGGNRFMLFDPRADNIRTSIIITAAALGAMSLH